MNKRVKHCLLAAAACGLAAMTAPAYAVDVTVKHGNMDFAIAQGNGTNALTSGNDVNLDGRLTGEGWTNWASEGATTGRYWDPSAVNRQAMAGNSWFDTSWGGQDASGDDEGQVLAIHTQVWDYRPAGSFFAPNGNPIWNMADAGIASDSTRVEFRFLDGGTPDVGSTSPPGYTYNNEIVGGVWQDSASRDFMGVAQVLTEAFDATAKYTLSVRVGRLAPEGFNAGQYISRLCRETACYAIRR
mgnify:CR=1 FL=1